MDKKEAIEKYLDTEVQEDYENAFLTEDGEEYLVLTEDEAWNLAKEYVIDLTDDMGLEAFSKDFQDRILSDPDLMDTEFIDEFIDEEIDYFESEEEDPDMVKHLEGLKDGGIDAKLDYVIDIFGKDEFAKMAAKHIDWDAVADEVISFDGVANQLALYDGKEIDLGDGLYAYRVD